MKAATHPPGMSPIQAFSALKEIDAGVSDQRERGYQLLGRGRSLLGVLNQACRYRALEIVAKVVTRHAPAMPVLGVRLLRGVFVIGCLTITSVAEAHMAAETPAAAHKAAAPAPVAAAPKASAQAAAAPAAEAQAAADPAVSRQAFEALLSGRRAVIAARNEARDSETTGHRNGGRGRETARRTSAKAAPRTKDAGGRILPDYKTIVLPNGLTVLVMEQHELPLVDFHLLVKTGATSDPKGREGLAAATAALLRQGTRAKTATQFSEAVDFIGGTLEAGADHDKTAVSGEFLARDFDTGLALLADMVLAPAFRQEEIERYRDQTLAGIQQDLDDPETLANKQFAKSLYEAHPYARPVEGTTHSVPALARADITRFYETYYAPNNAILAVVGDLETDAAAAAVRHVFGKWARKTVPRSVEPPIPTVKGRRVVLVDKPDVNQTQIRIGTIGIRRSDPAYFPAQIAATILGGGFTSWLNQEIREKRGLSYGASSRFEPRREPGPFVVSTFTKNETVKDTIDVALETLERFKDGSVGKEDLLKAQNYLAGQYPLTVETTDQLARQIAELVFYGLSRNFVDRQIQSLRSVTLEDLKGIARKLPMDDYVLIVVTNAAAVRSQLENLGTITVVAYDAVD